jgi:hypothetical protein
VELAWLIVDPGVRGQGLGWYLAAGLARLARLRHPLVFLRVHPGNTAALRCYATAGFEPVGRIRWPSGTPASRSATSGSAWPRNACPATPARSAGSTSNSGSRLPKGRNGFFSASMAIGTRLRRSSLGRRYLAKLPMAVHLGSYGEWAWHIYGP